MQNPAIRNLDNADQETVCNLYNAESLYVSLTIWNKAICNLDNAESRDCL